MKKDIFVITLGCPRNLVDAEVLTGKLKKRGFRILDKFEKGCVVVLNTCAFIEDAKRESIDFILRLADLKKSGGLLRLIIAGCLSQRYSKDLKKDIKEIDAIFGSSTFPQIPGCMERILNGEKVIAVEKEPRFLYDHKSPRRILTPRHSAYVKIQEGCMNFCSYCVIPRIRGPYRSRDTGSVLNEIRSLKNKGAREINLIGQDTTLYGAERGEKFALAKLLKKASAIMKSGWLRLLYTHPAHYNDRLIKVIAGEAPVCKYLDLPIQHINDKILKRMHRRVSKKKVIDLIKKLRKNIPNVAIRTSVIVGFPGETEKEFGELEGFIKDFRFDRLGVFTYSREDGTKAFSFPGQVPEGEKEARFKRIMKLQQELSRENNRRYIGKRVKTLIDEKDPGRPGRYVGRTEHDAPEVDGVVYVKSKKPLATGDFADVRIEDTLEYDLAGSV